MKSSAEKTAAMNRSAGKVLDIIDYFASQNNEPMRLQDISSGLSINPSTALRFLTALIEAGYVKKQPDTLCYSLTFKMCSIANSISSNIHLYDIALPEMKAISTEFDESVCLSVEQDMSVVYIGYLNGPDKLLNTMQRIGSRAPMYCTGSGKLMLLNHDEKYIDRLIATKGLIQFTPNTIVTKEALMKELDTVRIRGYANDKEECEIGARCVAVPIIDYSETIIAAISVTGTIFRLTETKIERKLNFLIEQGRKISAKLGSVANSM